MRGIVIETGQKVPLSLSQRGYRSFRTARELVAALRAEVMVKFQRQMHELELSEPGERPESAGGIEPWPYEW
jgi:hypothetical protein